MTEKGYFIDIKEAIDWVISKGWTGYKITRVLLNGRYVFEVERDEKENDGTH